MEEYMVVSRCEGSTYAKFFNDYSEAEQYRIDVECGIGGYLEVYERTTNEDGIISYTFLYA